MNYDFDKRLNRRDTASYKWDQSKILFGDADILPMWVADMDFKPPREVVDGIIERAEHGIYGYTFRTQEYYDAIEDWQRKRHGWEIRKEWIASSPGVVTALSLAVDTLTVPGDKIVIQTPVYYPFFDVVNMNGRELAVNPLKTENGQFVMDTDHLEQLLDDRCKLLLLCNPHNPGGRVWAREELLRLGEICAKRDILIVSDEIHEDLVYSGHRHTPFASLSEELANRTITCIAPTKTFNVAGIQTSAVIIPNPKLRKIYTHRLKALSIHMESYFGLTTMVNCYKYGAEWLDQLLVYLEQNRDALVQYMKTNLPQVEVMVPQGTYLAWMDCRALSENPEDLKRLMFREAKVAFNEGSVFGPEGAGFLRANFACPRSLMLEGLERFVHAVKG